MKKIIYIACIVLLSITLYSCGFDNHSVEQEDVTHYTNLEELLNDCDSYGVVISTIVYNGNYKSRSDGIIVQDGAGICREYVGGVTDAIVGDTIVIK